MYVFEAHALSGWYDAKYLIKTFLNNMSCCFPEQYLEDECTAGPWKELLLAMGKYFYIVLHKGTNLTSSNDLTCSQWSYGDIALRAKFLCCF